MPGRVHVGAVVLRVQVALDPDAAGALVGPAVLEVGDVGVEQARAAAVERERVRGHLAELAPERARVGLDQVLEGVDEHGDDLLLAGVRVAAEIFERSHPAPQHRLPRMRIRAAVLEEFGAPLAVQDVELAGPGPGEVLVRLLACGVCHTDLYTASGADPSGYAPCVLGHEGCGTVEAVGEGVTSVAEGDRVVTLFSPQCGECVHCRSARRRTSAWRSASSRTRATCPTARRASRATASRSGTSWAPRRSPRRR